MQDPKSRIDAIKNGTSLDHLNPGTALKVMKILGIHDTGVVTLGMNLESSKFGYKDIIKLENKELTKDEINKITLICPQASISIIKNYKVVRKFKVSLQQEIENIIKCRNPKCITNHEPTKTKFHVVSRSPLKFRCHYCERYMRNEDLKLV